MKFVGHPKGVALRLPPHSKKHTLFFSRCNRRSARFCSRRGKRSAQLATVCRQRPFKAAAGSSSYSFLNKSRADAALIHRAGHMNGRSFTVSHRRSVFGNLLAIRREFGSCLSNNQVIAYPQVPICWIRCSFNGVDHAPFAAEVRSSCRHRRGTWMIRFSGRTFGRFCLRRGRRGRRCPLIVWRIPLVDSIQEGDGPTT